MACLAVARVARRTYATAFRAYQSAVRDKASPQPRVLDVDATYTAGGATEGEARAAAAPTKGVFRRADGTSRRSRATEGTTQQRSKDAAARATLQSDALMPHGPRTGADEPLTEHVMPQEGNESYADALRLFVLHRSFRRLLMTEDAPHPLRVYEDVAQVLDHTPHCSLEDVSELISHAHVLLRLLADTDRPDAEQDVAVVPSKPGELVLAAKQTNTALHWAYHDTVTLWDTMNREQEVGKLGVSSMLRCCSVVGDTERAVSVFETYKDKERRFSSTILVNSMMWVYAEKGDMETCVKLYSTLKQSKGRLDTDTFEAMLHCAFKINEIHTVLRTWDKFTNGLCVQPRNATWEMMVLGCLDCGFEHHAVLYYDRYKALGITPTAYLQMRMNERYAMAIDENLTPGSKIPNAVARSPHLSYKMMIDFCRVKTLRDVTMPDHVPAVQPHYYAPLDGAGSGMDVGYDSFIPSQHRGQGRRYTSHSGRTKEWMIRGTGRMEFAPPGTADPPRKQINTASKFRTHRKGRHHTVHSYEQMIGSTEGRRKGKIILDVLGNKGRGAWAEEDRWSGAKFRASPITHTPGVPD